VQGREFKDAVFEQFARVASAFASPKRLEVVDLLAQGPRSVESIAAQTSMTVANTSRHLQVLRNAGLVASSRDAQRVVYRIADPTVVDGYRSLRQVAESRIAEVRYLAEAFFGEADGVEALDVAGLLERSKRGDVVVVDVRPPEEYAAGHIAGALSVPLADLAGRISELSKASTVVAYCRGPYCVLSAAAVRQLRSAGIPAQRLEAGVDEWRRAGRAVEVGAAS
jgi:rhodanese-related sulfurtransferase/biotin operon repressor